MMTDFVRLYRRFALSVAAASLVLAAGCGPQGGNSASSGSGPTTGSGAAGDAAVVRVGFFPNVTHAAALVGTGKGFFQQALGKDVKVEEQTFTAGPSEIEALFAGAIDIGYIGPGPAINGYEKSGGDALKIVAGAASGGAALVARTGAKVASVADLTGKRVAVPQTGGTQDISLRHALADAHLAPKTKGGTVDVVQYAPADVETQMQQSGVDAAWLPEPWVARLQKDGVATLVFDERDHWPNKKFATTVVIVRTQFLKDHAPLVAKFLAGHVAAVRWINEHPADAQKVIGERIAAITKKPLPDAVLATALKNTDITDDPQTETVLTFADWAKDLGYLREGRSSLSSLFDTTALEAARKEAASSKTP